MADQQHRGGQLPQPLQDAQGPGQVHPGEGLVQQVEPGVQGRMFCPAVRQGSSRSS